MTRKKEGGRMPAKKMRVRAKRKTKKQPKPFSPPACKPERKTKATRKKKK